MSDFVVFLEQGLDESCALGCFACFIQAFKYDEFSTCRCIHLVSFTVHSLRMLGLVLGCTLVVLTLKRARVRRVALCLMGTSATGTPKKLSK